jgi:hypothetical protein
MASVFIVAILGIQCFTMVWPREVWPFTPISMFSYDVSTSSPVYKMQFTLRFDDGERALVPTRDLLSGEGCGFRHHGSKNYANYDAAFYRWAFARYYGSTDPTFAYGHFGDDTHEAFLERLRILCRHISAVLSRQGVKPREIRIELWEKTGEDRRRDSEEHDARIEEPMTAKRPQTSPCSVIGRYVIDSDTFTPNAREPR